MNRKKIFLLFGATGALGRTAFEYFLQQDYDYHYIFARSEFKSNPGKNNLRVIIVGDLTKEEFVKEAFSEIEIIKEAEYFLFSTIGAFAGGKPISDTEYSDFQKMLDINLNSSFLLAKHFSKIASQAAGGCICFTSALSALKPAADKSAYNISKNALNFMVESLAIEGAEINLRANAVAPYAIDSESNRLWVAHPSELVSPHEICRTAESLFRDSSATGEIIKLPSQQ